MTEITTTEIVAYNEFRAQLAQLREYNDKAVFDYEDPQGNKDARSHIHKLRKTKAAVDACRKKEKKASLEYGRKVDGEAKQIIGEIEEMISVHAGPIAEIEQREKDRISDILDLIETIRKAAEDTDGRSAEGLRTTLEQIKNHEIKESVYQEFTEQAIGAKAMTIETMERIIAEQQKREDDQAELERLRKEAEQRAKKEREERIAKEAAERARKEAEEKSNREKREAEQRELALKAAQERAEREKKEAEQRAIQAEERAKQAFIERQRKEQEEREKREANKRHCASINQKAINALAEIEGITAEQAEIIVSQIAKGKIPNVSIGY